MSNLSNHPLIDQSKVVLKEGKLYGYTTEYGSRLCVYSWKELISHLENEKAEKEAEATRKANCVPIETNTKFRASMTINIDATLEKIRDRLEITRIPTKEDINKYFADIQDHYAGSNDGSEMLANAELTITEI